MQGGGDRQALYLARELQEMGHDVAVYTPTYDRQRCYPEVCSHLRVIVTGEHPLARLPLLSGRLRMYFNMRRLADALDGPFDVINPHHWPPHWAAVRAARRMSPAPAVIWMCNDPPWPPLAAAQGIRRLGRPLRSLSRRFFLRFDRRMAKGVTRIVVLSRYAKRLIDETYGSDCAIVRSGVDAAALRVGDKDAVGEIRRRHGISEKAFVLLSLGILMPHRRLEDAIAGVARVAEAGRDIHFVAAGSPSQYPAYAASLRELTRELGIENRVTFAGAVSEGDLKLYYHACDAFVFPNENQTWALAVTEAMACGKPVVVSTGAAVTETLTDGKTALLTPPRDPEAMAAALTRLIESPKLRQEVGENGRRYVTDTLSWRRYAESMVSCFSECAAGEGRVAATDEQPSAEAA